MIQYRSNHMKFQYIPKAAMLVIAFIITFTTSACSNARVNQRSGGGGGHRAVVVGYKNIPITQTTPASAPIRVQVNPGEGIAVTRATKIARDNGFHGELEYQACMRNGNTNLPWMTEIQIRKFFNDQPDGVDSPYCGSVYVRGQAATITTTQQIPITQQVALEAEENEESSGGGDQIVVNDSYNKKSFHFFEGLFSGSRFLFAPRSEVDYRGGSRIVQRTYSSHRAERECPPCPRCGIVHPGRPCPHMSQGSSGGRRIIRVHNNNWSANRNTLINSAPRGYYPSSGRSSRPFGYGGSSGPGYGQYNPGLKLY